jgi:hypothetical protein
MLGVTNVLSRSIKRFLVTGSLVASSWPGALAGQPVEAPAVVLVKTFADGRTTHAVVTARKAGSWTPMFPRLKGWTPPPGQLAVSALGFSHVLTTQGISLQVSVMRGSPHQQEDRVGSFHVRLHQTVTVEALRDYGLEPVTFSLIPLDRTTLIPPGVVNQTAGLAVESFEPITDPDPRYRVVIRNLTTKAAVMFFVNTFAADRLATSGRQGHQDGSPLIKPGGSFEFFLRGSSHSTPTAHGWAPQSLDRLELSTVLWDDGSFEGETEHVATSLLSYVGRRAQLRRVVDIMKNVAASNQDLAATISRLRKQFEALPLQIDDSMREEALDRLKSLAISPPKDLDSIIQAHLGSVRTGVLRDLAGAPTTSSTEFARWHRELAAQYDDARVSLSRR